MSMCRMQVYLEEEEEEEDIEVDEGLFKMQEEMNVRLQSSY